MNLGLIFCHNPTCAARCADGQRARAVGWSAVRDPESRHRINWWCPRCTKDRDSMGGA